MLLQPSAYLPDSADGHAVRTTLSRLERYHQMLQRDLFFSFKCEGEHQRIPYADISYFESSAKKVMLHSVRDGKRYCFAAKLDDLAQGLPSCFLRCHQSYGPWPGGSSLISRRGTRRWSIWNRFWDPGLSFSTNSPAVSKQSTIWMGTSPTCSGCFGSILRTANDFRTAPIITGEATLPLRWLRQLPLCGLAGRNYLALQVAPVRQVF